MRVIGVVGGMSWESTAIYYRLLNRMTQERLGGQHSARILLYSVDFQEIADAQQAGDWTRAGEVLVDAARRLEAAGADFGLLATNTMHKVFDAIQASVGLPFIHLADATAERIRADGLRRVALLGTRYTMEQDFYRGRLAGLHGIEAIIPDAAGRDEVHRVIYDELCHGDVRPASRAAYVRIIEEMAARGAQGVILGCTEITLLIGAGDVSIPVYDTTAIHAEAALERALAPASV